MAIVQAVFVGLVIVAALVLVHLLLRWMDDRGWIFYHSDTKRPLGARSAMALTEFETLMNPAAEHILEYRRHGDLWVQDANADDPDPPDDTN